MLCNKFLLVNSARRYFNITSLEGPKKGPMAERHGPQLNLSFILAILTTQKSFLSINSFILHCLREMFDSLYCEVI